MSDEENARLFEQIKECHYQDCSNKYYNETYDDIARLMEEAPERFELFARIGLELRKKDSNSGHGYFTHGWKMARIAPEKLQEYADKGLEIGKGEYLEYFRDVPEILTIAPEHYPLYQELALKIAPTPHKTRYWFFDGTLKLIKKAPQHFTQFATTGLQVLAREPSPKNEYTPNMSQVYFREALELIQQNPEAAQQYMITGAELLNEETDVGVSFIMNAPLVIRTQPRFLTAYIRAGKEIQKQKGYTALFFSGAPELIHTMPQYFPLYADIATKLTDANKESPYLTKVSVLSVGPRILQRTHTSHRDAILPAIRKLLEKDKDQFNKFYDRLPGLLQKLDPAKTCTEDELLIAYIHDQHSAHEIGKLINKGKYGKQYAQKCGSLLY